MPINHDTLLRQWQMLRSIPKYPQKITATQIKSKLDNEDFIVVAISSISDINKLIPNELFHGFVNINYEIHNLRDINVKISDNNYIKVILTLPVKNIYKMFMDVYNENLFESKKYKIDENNYESWNGISLNKSPFTK